MKLNPREVRLGLVSLVAILVGLTFWVGEPLYEEWKQSQEEVDQLKLRRDRAQQLLEQGPDLNARLEQLREILPSYPEGADVTSQILRNLQQTADRHGLLLTRIREPEPERRVQDLYELAINAQWEGELNALVHFLYALHAQGAIVDVRQLTVDRVQNDPARLRGNITVDYAYSRTAGDT